MLDHVVSLMQYGTSESHGVEGPWLIRSKEPCFSEVQLTSPLCTLKMLATLDTKPLCQFVPNAPVDVVSDLTGSLDSIASLVGPCSDADMAEKWAKWKSRRKSRKLQRVQRKVPCYADLLKTEAKYGASKPIRQPHPSYALARCASRLAREDDTSFDFPRLLDLKARLPTIESDTESDTDF
eukprot:TRINITY_DN48344_c0_g1_i1.p1 TRINITY_DN48344_c0_g1~~TRINITY_DN48344_c0_g1_i1.p1  ORF type:complete len:181 (-),score=20.04 TRINITY_DN48344_c0_g1_i1:419-961(-)